jgi:hypothetical protein
MKKLIIIGSTLIAISAGNLFLNQSANGNGKAQVFSAVQNADTTPKKKDTTYFAYNTANTDTTPKKKDTTYFAYNTASADTTPKKKDTTYFAYNLITSDTTPKKKDTTYALLALK